MSSYITSLCIFKIALPILLIVSTVFRPCLISGVYLLFFFILPMMPVRTCTSQVFPRHSTIYLKILIAFSTLSIASQILFHSIIYFTCSSEEQTLTYCNYSEPILRHVGFVKLDHINYISALTWLSPEVIMFIGSIVVFKACKTPNSEPEPVESGNITIQSSTTNRRGQKFATTGVFLVLTSLCLAAVFRPSIPGGIYFLVFLSATTWWSCSKALGKKFGILLSVITFIVALHLIAIFVYQMPWPASLVPKSNPYMRYFGITNLMEVDNDDPRKFIWATDEEWDSFVNPFALLWLYFISILVIKNLLKPTVGKSDAATESTPLINSSSPKSSYSIPGRRSVTVRQDSRGSVTVTEELPNDSDAPLDNLSKGSDEGDETLTLFDKFYLGIDYVIELITKSSFIFTNVTMMTWSISFPSWLGFAFLITANILWMVPNQRQAMFRFSPFLICYALLLLISGYVFSMNLTDEELPQIVNGVNLEIIGFAKVYVVPCRYLLLKCVYTGMFWIMLKQYTSEMYEARQARALALTASPVEAPDGTATGVAVTEPKSKQAAKLKDFQLKKFLTKFWIAIVALTLFAVAITGERMTLFRIIYMAFFLIFIITFQISITVWRKLMFAFWIIIILYSMVILILVYTYQFENIRNFWSTYLGLTKEEQLDIGLEFFAAKQLFVRLSTSTFFVIIIAIQIHYFHEDFMILSEPVLISEANTQMESSLIEDDEEKTDLDISSKLDVTDQKSLFKARLQTFAKQLNNFVDLALLFLEIHLPTIVLFVACLMFIYDKCAVYLCLVLFNLIAVLIGRRVRSIALYITSVFAGIFVILRMLYQTRYINVGFMNSTCELSSTSNMTDAEWIGFRKITPELSLYGIVMWNILYIFSVTLMSIIYLRRHNCILPNGSWPRRASLMFPKIKRTDADKNIWNCVQYLLNYGFYRFGLEICVIFLAFLVSIRLDIYGIFYSIVLCVFVGVRRSLAKRIWKYFFFILIFIISFQYVNLVGLPPSICDSGYWTNNPSLERLSAWLFGYTFKYNLPGYKTLYDMVLFILVSRQCIAFDKEDKFDTENSTYPGGSNQSIIHHADDPNFAIPVPDFITYCRSYLDVIKRALFLSWMWLSLAIVFLAGTNRVSAFSIGYLLVSFIFLWHGSDTYLTPIRKILSSWNTLIAFNLLVIFLKSSFQFGGCVYYTELNKYSCWVVQIFAIGCANEYVKTETSTDEFCNVPSKEVGLVWDAVVFTFLILQRRIFCSYYFFHVINETKATTILASRGAELIEELRYKKIIEQQEGEKRVIEKIKQKMERIKANQKKILGDNYKDITNHHVAIRSGDYYMFDEIENEELELIDDVRAPITEELEDDFNLGRTPTLSSVEPHARVAFIDPKGKEEPQPGTSKDEDESLSDVTEPKTSFFDYLVIAWTFIESGCQSLAFLLNTYSRDYRYILRVLNQEKKTLKDKTKYHIGLRLGKKQIWRPTGTYQSLLGDSLVPTVTNSKENSDENLSTQEKEPDTNNQATSTLSFSPEIISHEETHSHLEQFDDAEMSSVDQPPIIRLLLSIWHLILSHSHLLCYFVIFLKQIKSATCLSLPLPILVLFWGTLTIPRPSKTFWVTIIAYTEIIVVVTCVFQFDVIPWNKSQFISPLFPPRIIGIEKQDNYAFWDLLLLLVVFFHRYLLKCLGLWKSMYIPAVVLTDGDYQISSSELKEIEHGELPSSLQHDGDSASDTHIHSKSLNLRKGSDLEKLVEEPDEGNDEVEGTEEAEGKNIVTVKTSRISPAANIAAALRLGITRYRSAVTTFFRMLFDPSTHISTDVYAYMFLCDFFNFFVILLGYSSFGPYTGDQNVSDYLTENRVPGLFLAMLIVQFLLIITDRGIFLRKNLLAKIIFQFLQIMFLHIWLFVFFPLITDRAFNSVLAPQIYYMVKCLYLILSAYQIRSGYPTRILGNYICRGYNYVNLFLYKGYLAVPFLYELRMVMDWMWTDTSMSIFDWMKMEDIFSHIFQVKCARYVEAQFPQIRGEKKPSLVKYFMGGLALLAMFVIIWFPLVFFALGDAVGSSNIPFSVTLELRIGPYEPIYRMTAQSNSIIPFDENDYNMLLHTYDQDKTALTFILNYQPSDIAIIKFSDDSAAVWTISPPDRQRMIDTLNSTDEVQVSLLYFLSHTSNSKEDPGNIREEVIISLDDQEARNDLLNMLIDKEIRPPVTFRHIIPQFIKVTNKGTAKPVPQLMSNHSGFMQEMFRDIQVQRRSGEGNTEWWRINEIDNDTDYHSFLQFIPYYHLTDTQIYSFNEKLFPQTLSFITAGGIIGVYTTIVLVLGRLLRTIFSGACFRIMFDDLPYVDRVLQLCYDIFLVRETGDFTLEEDLFAKLIFLFRSPETLIKWSRPKDEVGDDDDEDEEGNDSSHK